MFSDQGLSSGKRRSSSFCYCLLPGFLGLNLCIHLTEQEVEEAARSIQVCVSSSRWPEWHWLFFRKLTTDAMQLLKSVMILRVTEITMVGSQDSVIHKETEASFPKFFYFIKGHYKSPLSSITMINTASIY